MSAVPVRKRAEDASEMVSQLLFGETITVLSIKNKSWIRVKCDYDGYIGWIDPKMITYIFEEDHEKYQHNVAVSLDLTGNLINNNVSFPVLIGSSFANFDGISFKSPLGKHVYNGQVAIATDVSNKAEILTRVARKYLHAPYLWGGRSPFGIDCSGLVQVLYKIVGVALPRDASQQVDHGRLVDFVELCQPGDLAYFCNDSGKIIHVGMLLDDNQIIHASGQVRIDLLDHVGIYDVEKKKYSHHLKYIKRLLPDRLQSVTEEE